MNLHGIVSRGIGAVNPNFMVTVKSPTGVVVTTPAGGRLPQRSSSNFFAQVQSLTYQDLVKLDGLNIQGVRRAIYTNGYIASTLRIEIDSRDHGAFSRLVTAIGDIGGDIVIGCGISGGDSGRPAKSATTSATSAARRRD